MLPQQTGQGLSAVASLPSLPLACWTRRLPGSFAAYVGNKPGTTLGPDLAAPCGSATLPDGLDTQQQIYVATDERILTKKDGTKKNTRQEPDSPQHPEITH
jgi:hypothetical protein